MPAYLIARLFMAAWVIFGVTSLVFFLIHWVPGDPVEVMLGESASAVDREALRQALGLNQPILQQWGSFLTGVFTFDLGTSLFYQQPVMELLNGRYMATLELAVVAFAIAVVIAIPLGVIAAARQGTAWDFGAMGFSLLGVSIPNFWLGPLLVLVFSLGGLVSGQWPGRCRCSDIAGDHARDITGGHTVAYGAQQSARSAR